jgi:UDP-N-acetylmuramoyl-L-alanyl-D-glutamate--2,6-diaminopimelate ligase
VFDGEDFIPAAVDRGAVAVVARPEAKVERVPHLADAEPRRLFAELAARFYAPYPDTVVAVTGTNGKTSTVEMTRQIWRMSGHRAASIGTLGVTTSDDQVKTGLTTPDIVTFLHNMAGLERMGISHVAYEASSHGLDQHRCEGVPLTAAAFTNFSRDHLDYHETMDSYFEAKMRLFDELLPPGATAVVWTDDPKSEEVIERAQARGHKLLTVGRSGETIRLVDQNPTPLGQALLLEHEDRSLKLSLPLIGAYQAANVLVAAGLVMATGVGFDRAFSAMQRVAPVRGRLERAVISRAGAPVYIDYAHTPDALEAAIAALRPHVDGRLITVFGAGGDRDQGKRPQMGKVAVEMSNVAIVTDDNPRSEDPARIRADIMAGASGATEVPGRREAIAEAIRIARDGDIVLLAGKGHETGQIIGDRVLPFDDALVARECAA